MCGWPGQPNHGEQLLIWGAVDLTGATEGIYLKGGTDDAWGWHGVKGSDGFFRPADYSAKLDPRCKGRRCRTLLRLQCGNVGWLFGGDAPASWREAVQAEG